MSKRDAVRKLGSSRTVASPVTTRADPESIARSTDLEGEFEDLWERANAAIGPSNTFESAEVELADVPDGPGVSEHLDAFVDDPHARASLDKRSADRWEIKMVPIENLVAFQPSITTTSYRDDVPTDADDVVSLLEFALPVDAGPVIEDQRVRDTYFTGWQFVSRDPNVHISGPNYSQSNSDDTVFATVEFAVKSDPNFCYVAHFEDRYILKNGYHRTYQLMQSGHTHVPAVVLEAETYEDTGGTQSRFFDREVVMGQRPPMLPDYDTRAAVEVDRRTTNRVIRIIAETTDVLR